MPKRKAQIMLDIILPKNIRLDSSSPSDVEASALYDMWRESPPGTNAFSVPKGMLRHINAWKTKGLVEGFSNSLALTDKGRKLINEMVTSEPNSFEKKASMPKYSTIKAHKRLINSRRLKAASKQAKPFNLRRERDEGNNS